MISLIQGVHNLVGAEKDIEALAKKESARILVISDSHGKYNVLYDIIKNFGEDCDALVFCGDGALDISMFFDAAFHDKELLQKIPPVAAFVQGNGDYSKYPVEFGSKQLLFPARQTFTAAGKNFMVVHGHRESVNWGFDNLGLQAQLENCSYAFYGHTHVACETRMNDFVFINPGSCARPRGGQPSCFAITTVGKNFVDTAFIKIEPKGDGTTNYSLFTPVCWY